MLDSLQIFRQIILRVLVLKVLFVSLGVWHLCLQQPPIIVSALIKANNVKHLKSEIVGINLVQPRGTYLAYSTHMYKCLLCGFFLVSGAMALLLLHLVHLLGGFCLRLEFLLPTCHHTTVCNIHMSTLSLSNVQSSVLRGILTKET